MALTNNKRGKAKYTSDYTLKDAYEEFSEKHPEIDYKTYVEVYKTFITEVMCLIIEKAADFRLFHRLGELGIRKRKIEKRIDKDGNLLNINRDIDWGETIKLWEKEYGTTDRAKLKSIQGKPIIRYNNKHNNGFTLKIFWDKILCNVKNQRQYVFKPSRDFKRAVNKLSKEKNLDYYETKR